MTDSNTKVFMTDALEQELHRILQRCMPAEGTSIHQGIVDQLVREDRGAAFVTGDFTRRDAIEKLGRAIQAIYTDEHIRKDLHVEFTECMAAFTYGQIRDHQQMLDKEVAQVEVFDNGHQYLNKAWDKLLREPFDQLRLAAAETDESNSLLRRCAHLLYYAQHTQNFVPDPTAPAVLGFTFKTEEDYFSTLTTYCDALASIWRFEESFDNPDLRLSFKFVRRLQNMVISLRDNASIDPEAADTTSDHMTQITDWLSDYSEAQAKYNGQAAAPAPPAPVVKALRRNTPEAEKTQAQMSEVVRDVRENLERGGFTLAPSSVNELAWREQALATVREEHPELHSLGADPAHDEQVEQLLTQQHLTATAAMVASEVSETAQLLTHQEQPLADLDFGNIDWNQHPSNRVESMTSYPGIDRALVRSERETDKGVDIDSEVQLRPEPEDETPFTASVDATAFTQALGVVVGIVTGQFGLDGAKIEQIGELLDKAVAGHLIVSVQADHATRFYKLLQAIPADDPATIQRREFLLQFVAWRVYVLTGGLEVNMVT